MGGVPRRQAISPGRAQPVKPKAKRKRKAVTFLREEEIERYSPSSTPPGTAPTSGSPTAPACVNAGYKRIHRKSTFETLHWRLFFRRDVADAEQQQELQFYLDITAEEYVERGME